jgi:ketosteroid isomerase-like protein
VVERWLAAFDRRWPTEDELAALLAPEVVFVERPNLLRPAGSERDAAAMRAGIARGPQLLAWQAYTVRDHIASGDTVVTRMRWTGELCLAGGRIVHIEQHDCYEQPSRA